LFTPPRPNVEYVEEVMEFLAENVTQPDEDK